MRAKCACIRAAHANDCADEPLVQMLEFLKVMKRIIKSCRPLMEKCGCELHEDIEKYVSYFETLQSFFEYATCPHVVLDGLKAKPIIQPTATVAGDNFGISAAAASPMLLLSLEKQKAAVVSNQLMKDEQNCCTIFSPGLKGRKTFRMQALHAHDNSTALKIPHWKCAGGECKLCGAATRFKFQCGIEYDKFECVDVWL